MGADGRIVRGRPGGTWLSRMHRWTAVRQIWPDGMPEVPELQEAVEPSALLLPALDPTPMGWQQRGFFLGPHREPLFDRNGNIGPTVWWDGRIIGGWGMKGPEIVWRELEDVGAEAHAPIATAAAGLQAYQGRR